MTRIITFGTFDVFHVGHLNLLERARGFGDYLIVGISTDVLNISKKGRSPVFPQNERSRIVAALKCVDKVFFEHSLEAKRDYIQEHRADVLVMGDDWASRFDELSDVCRVEYLSRTPSISTTATIERMRS